jgi:hypothetical protein
MLNRSALKTKAGLLADLPLAPSTLTGRRFKETASCPDSAALSSAGTNKQAQTHRRQNLAGINRDKGEGKWRSTASG